MTALPPFTGSYGLPGMSDVVQSVENNFMYGRVIDEYLDMSHVVGTARDAGNTSATTYLRPGLLLGRVTSTGKLKEWNPGATDGSERIVGVNSVMMSMQQDGVNTDRFYNVVTWGTLRTEGLIIPGETTIGLDGKDYEHVAAAQLLEAGFRLNNPYPQGAVVRKDQAATATLTDVDGGKLITDYGASGTTVLTIPDPVPGLKWKFVNVTANQRTISPASNDQIIGLDEAGSGYDDDIDSVIMTGQGSVVELEGVEVGTDTYQYIITNLINCTTDDNAA